MTIAKEISQLQKKIEEHHISIQKANEEKLTAIEELKKKTKKMKELKHAVEKEYRIQEQFAENDRTKRIYSKKRTNKDYNLSINLTALRKLTGTPQRSFLSLAKNVIMIDGKPYDGKVQTLSTERKNDFKRLIEYHAMLEFTGERKCIIKHVYTKKQRETLNELEIFSTKEKSQE